MIIFADENIPLLQSALSECESLIPFHGRKLTNADLLSGKCDFLFVRSTTKVNSELLEGTCVRFIGTATSGTDHIDLNELERRGISFAYAPGSNANSVAEYVVYSILVWLNITRSTPNGKTAGIIGFGNIGKIVAAYARNMGFKVLVNDPPLLAQGFVFPEWTEHVSLERICCESDVLTNHVPLLKAGYYATVGLIDEKLISCIKAKCLIIHASRGGVIVEEPLLKRLSNSEIFGAIDVWENEPFVNKELAELAFIATPHIAGYSRDGKLRGTLQMLEAFEKYSGCKPDFSEIQAAMGTYKPLSINKFKDFDYLLELLKNNRLLDRDTADFKAIFSLTDKDRALAFDNLRKNYPERRESL